MAKATHYVIIYKTGRLHKGVANSWADEAETATQQILAQCL